MIRLSWTSPPIRPSEAPGPSVMAAAAASSSTTAWPSTPRPARSSAWRSSRSSPASPAPRGRRESNVSSGGASRSSGLRDFKASARPRKGPVGWISPTAGPTSSRPCGPRMDLGHQFLFRATQDRKIRRGPEPTDKAAYLKRLARSLPASVSSTVEVPGRGSSRRRRGLQMAATKVSVQVPAILEGPSSRVGTDPGVVEAGLGSRAACGGRGAAGVDPAQFVAGADRGGIAPQAGVGLAPPPDRGFPPGGEDRLR